VAGSKHEVAIQVAFGAIGTEVVDELETQRIGEGVELRVRELMAVAGGLVPIPTEAQQVIPGLQPGRVERRPEQGRQRAPRRLPTLESRSIGELPGGQGEQAARRQARARSPRQRQSGLAPRHVMQDAEEGHEIEGTGRERGSNLRTCEEVLLDQRHRLRHPGGQPDARRPEQGGVGVHPDVGQSGSIGIGGARRQPRVEKGRQPRVAATDVEDAQRAFFLAPAAVPCPSGRRAQGREHAQPSGPGMMSAGGIEVLRMGAVEPGGEREQLTAGELVHDGCQSRAGSARSPRLRLRGPSNPGKESRLSKPWTGQKGGSVPAADCVAAPAPRVGGRHRGRGPDRDFDPRPLRATLLPLLRAIEALPEETPEPLTAEWMEPLLRRYPRPGGGFFSRSQLIAGFRAFAAEEPFCFDESRFRRRVQRRPVRTQSGVTPLTVLTKPFPCPGKCIFCPNDVRMPKSYLSDEPGAQRAANNRFDPYLQTWNRLAAFEATGHPVDKVELIVLGGTWSFHPEAYQVWFVKRCLEAMNDFGAGCDGRDAVEAATPDFETIDARIEGDRFRRNPYNARVVRFLAGHHGGGLVVESERSEWAALEAAQRRNETAGARCVGLVLETRPDHVDEAEVLRLRRLGATKVQLGVQSLDDAILTANRRGHGVDATRRAFALLRRAGFKLHAHWMANLLGATPESDRADFARLFDEPAYRPDELKLYPCSLVETAELMGPWRRGEWRPYSDDELLSVVTEALVRVPRYCRVTRVIRDISSDDIVVGNKRTNFRQIAEAEIARRGARLVEIRHREIRARGFDEDALRLVDTEYGSGTGRERFLELVTGADRIVGFLRLSLPQAPSFVAELGRNALVRELHVYGGAVGIGTAAGRRAQHRGLGARLLAAAEDIAAEAGHPGLSVISAIGTRDYYHRHGFEDGALYQHRRIRPLVGPREPAGEGSGALSPRA